MKLSDKMAYIETGTDTVPVELDRILFMSGSGSVTLTLTDGTRIEDRGSRFPTAFKMLRKRIGGMFQTDGMAFPARAVRWEDFKSGIPVYSAKGASYTVRIGKNASGGCLRAVSLNRNEMLDLADAAKKASIETRLRDDVIQAWEMSLDICGDLMCMMFRSPDIIEALDREGRILEIDWDTGTEILKKWNAEAAGRDGYAGGRLATSRANGTMYVNDNVVSITSTRLRGLDRNDSDDEDIYWLVDRGHNRLPFFIDSAELRQLDDDPGTPMADAAFAEYRDRFVWITVPHREPILDGKYESLEHAKSVFSNMVLLDHTPGALITPGRIDWTRTRDFNDLGKSGKFGPGKMALMFRGCGSPLAVSGEDFWALARAAEADGSIAFGAGATSYDEIQDADGNMKPVRTHMVLYIVDGNRLVMSDGHSYALEPSLWSMDKILYHLKTVCRCRMASTYVIDVSDGRERARNAYINLDAVDFEDTAFWFDKATICGAWNSALTGPKTELHDVCRICGFHSRPLKGLWLKRHEHMRLYELNKKEKKNEGI